MHCKLLTVRMGMVFALFLYRTAAGGDPPIPGQDWGDLNRCGPISLQVCSIASGRPVGSQEIEAILPRDGREWSLLELDDCARKLGLRTFAARWRTVPPSIGGAPAIIPIRQGSTKHFVSLLGRSGDEVLIVDPPFDPTWVRITDLKQKLGWEGYALHVSTSVLQMSLLSLFLHARDLAILAVIGALAWMFWRRRFPRGSAHTVAVKTPLPT